MYVKSSKFFLMLYKTQIDSSSSSITDLYISSTTKYWNTNTPILKDEKTSVTYKTLWQTVHQLASYLEGSK
jgi:hypothetical protein